MTDRNTVLVTGATGNVGRHLVSELLDAGAAVRAMTRSPETADLPSGVEVAYGDLSAPETLAEPLDGVGTVFLLFPTLAAERTAPASVTTIARHARRVVYLSSAGVRESSERPKDPINRSHADMEQLIEDSGLEWTFLRAGGFAGNTLGWASGIRTDGVVRAPFAAAGRSLIHERDIAAVAARVLTGDGHGGAKYVLTGPEVLTQVEQVHTIGAAIGRTLRYEEIPPEEALRQMIDDGLPHEFADGILNAHAGMVTEPEQVTTTVEEITGKPARTFREWATDHATDFREPARDEHATTEAVAREYVSLCRQGKFEEAMERFMSPDVVRVESADMAGPPVEIRGIEAVQDNSRGMFDDHDVHGAEVDGPFVGGERFAVRFTVDATFGPTGQRTTTTKMDLYTVAGGKLVRNEVYYHAPPPAVRN